MTNEQARELAQLRAKDKLSPTEKAKLKSLERIEKKHQASDKPKPARNATFGITPTTKLTAVPFRISGQEKTIMTDTALRIKNTELFFDRLGGKDDLSNNMQMRAALLAYNDLSDEDRVEYIRKAKLAMARAN